MKKIVILGSLIAILMLFVLGCTTKAPEVAPQPAPMPIVDTPAVEESIAEEEATAPAAEEEIEDATENIIEMTSSGFNPQAIVINAGETVTFITRDSAEHWPASNMHPTHTTYPGSSRDKCGTADESSIFDACKGLAEGEEYSFTFTRTGRWPFHDHRNPGKGGTVVVK